MNRREFSRTTAVAALGLGGTAWAADQGTPQFYELRTYELRNDLPLGQIHSFFEKTHLPRLQATASGPVGVFEVVSGQPSPSLILLISYDSPDRLRSLTQLTAATDKEEWAAFEASGMPFVRYGSEFFRAFEGHPRVEPPATGSSPHLFELRRYESKDSFKAAAKVDMFNQEEIKIFRDCGMHPVFFGEAVIGQRLPHLTYMLAFKDMADRDKAWGTFASNPDWTRIKDDPRWTDTVSVIHASFLRPARYSQIR